MCEEILSVCKSDQAREILDEGLFSDTIYEIHEWYSDNNSEMKMRR